MIGWNNFIWFAASAALCWILGAVLSLRAPKNGSKTLSKGGAKNGTKGPDGQTAAPGHGSGAAVIVSLIGSAIFLAFIIGMWISLERPPMRTQGETRLWYSLFLSLTGIAVYARWKYRWILSFSTMMSVMFTCINLFKPEIHSKTLMPALQSPWFVPHVTVYMFAYALMGAATLFAIYIWWKSSRNRLSTDDFNQEMTVCDTLVKIGWAFLTLGMTMGALWAKEAWGDFWTWDPKETWALATWLSYMLYIHLIPSLQTSVPQQSHGQQKKGSRHRIRIALLIFSFILLQMCWWGVNLLPSAQSSVHTY